MLILMGTSSSEQINLAGVSPRLDGYDFAVVNIGDSEARRLMEVIKQFEAAKEIDQTLLLMTFSPVDAKCEFYSFLSDDVKMAFPENARKVMDDRSGYVVLPDDFFMPITPKDALEPQYLILIVGDDGFWWQTFPGTSYNTIDTETLPKHLLSQIL
jgi:hypothetical protein